MADIQSIWLPRRGLKSVMAGSQQNVVLAKGEFHCECPDTGIGTGHGKAKIGDGVTPYKDLPYFLGDTENNVIPFDANTSKTVASALNAVVTGAKLKNIIAGLKQAIILDDARLTESIKALQTSFQAGVDTLYNKCTSLGVTPADKTPTGIANAIQKIYNDRYTTGYNAGRAQGRQDVINDPSAYGVSTEPKAYGYYRGYWTTNVYNVYTTPKEGSYKISIQCIIQNSYFNGNRNNEIKLIIPGVETTTLYYMNGYGKGEPTYYPGYIDKSEGPLYVLDRYLPANATIQISLAPSEFGAGYDGDPVKMICENAVSIVIM